MMAFLNFSSISRSNSISLMTASTCLFNLYLYNPKFTIFVSLSDISFACSLSLSLDINCSSSKIYFSLSSCFLSCFTIVSFSLRSAICPSRLSRSSLKNSLYFFYLLNYIIYLYSINQRVSIKCISFSNFTLLSIQ